MTLGKTSTMLSGVLRFLFRRRAWPALVFIAAWFWMICGAFLFLFAARDSNGLVLRGLPHPFYQAAGICAVALLGILRFRLFVWMCCLPWALAVLEGWGFAWTGDWRMLSVTIFGTL